MFVCRYKQEGVRETAEGRFCRNFISLTYIYQISGSVVMITHSSFVLCLFFFMPLCPIGFAKHIGICCYDTRWKTCEYVRSVFISIALIFSPLFLYLSL